MKAYQITEFGGKAGIRDVEIPTPGPGEIRVRIAACGLNFADLLMMKGDYQERPPLPVTLGMELAGTVDALAPGVAGPAPGTRVAVFSGSGGLAEFGCFTADRCLTLPEAMDFDTAASFQIAYGTSHVALCHRARLRAGETLVVLGAAGGVGLTAVEIGHRLGARVIAVARGRDRLAVAQAAGADSLIDSDATPDLRGALQGQGGADVIYDPVGGEQGAAALRALRPEGRHLVIGFASGSVAPVPANLLLVKNISLIGFYWGGYLRFRPEVLTDSLATLIDWHAQGLLRPHVGHRFAFARCDEALELLRRRSSTGKIVVEIQSA